MSSSGTISFLDSYSINTPQASPTKAPIIHPNALSSNEFLVMLLNKIQLRASGLSLSFVFNDDRIVVWDDDDGIYCFFHSVVYDVFYGLGLEVEFGAILKLTGSEIF